MKDLKLLFLSIFSLFVSSLFLTMPKAYAGDFCTGFYGGGYTGSISCAKITIDKKVLIPGTKDYVDNLTLFDSKYHSGENVIFQIVIQNSGDENLSDIQVIDTLPQYVEFVSGPGNFDKNTNKLTFNVSLNSGESQTYYISAKVINNIAFNKDINICTTNYVRAEKKDSASADDSASFCIERVLKVQPPVLGLKKAPPTGPEAIALPMLFGLGGMGWLLKRKTQKMFSKGVTK